MPVVKLTLEQMLQQLKDGQIAPGLLRELVKYHKETLKTAKSDLIKAIQAAMKEKRLDEALVIREPIFDRIVSDNAIAFLQPDRKPNPESKKLVPIFAQVLIPAKGQLPEGSPPRADLVKGFIKGFNAKFAALANTEIEFRFARKQSDAAGTSDRGVARITDGRIPHRPGSTSASR